ncbi:hypothetical protein PSDI105340_17355 [Pseudoalteromonas distincta]
MTPLYQDSQNTNHPGLLYYQWSRNNDQSALTKLLAIENDKSVTQSAEIQFFLASYTNLLIYGVYLTLRKLR